MSGTTTSPFGEHLRAFRIRAGLSQEALSETSGVSVRTISDLERGQRQSAHLETVRMLASALDLTSDERRSLLAAARPDNAPLVFGSTPTAFGNSRWTGALPSPVTPLIGRVAELDTLTARLTAPTKYIVTLTGPGGVGKTRLAIEAAHRLAPSYADGVAFVALATITQAEVVPDAIARALGLTPRSGAQIDQLAAFLGSRELLLVLDNLEQIIESATFVARLSAACPNLTVLVTSRVRLHVSTERAIALPPLSLADASMEQHQTSEAVQLFVDCAQRVDPLFELMETNVATVAEICRRVDSLPLAIELAAARLRILPPPVLLERLDRRLPLLTGGDRDLPLRQQSMRETIAWSYDLLGPAAKQFFRWMSVFTGVLSLDACEALGQALGLDPTATLEIVTILADSSLTARSGPSLHQPRFHLLETIREFGQEQLAKTDELDAARMFHATHFLQFASQDAPRPDEPISVAWVSRLAGEYPNLLVAFDFLCVPETADQCLRFAAAMGAYWHTRGLFSEWESRLTRAFALASPEPTVLKTHVLFWLSLIRGATSDFATAQHTASLCIEMASTVGTPSDQAAAIGILAWVHECHEHWEIARELRIQGIAFSKAAGNSYTHGINLVSNAISAYALGEFDRAQREAERARALFQEAGSVDWLASTECSQGMFAVAAGQLDRGAAYFAQSLRIWMTSEISSRLYRPLVGLADVAATLGDFTAAARLLGAADEMLIVGGRGLAMFDRPSYTRAETRAREALGPTDFDHHRRAGHLLPPADWLTEAAAIVEEARATPPS